MSRDRQRIEELLRIRVDGAQSWDVTAYVRDREAGKDAADPWRLGEGETPLTDAEITALIAAADDAIVASVCEDVSSVLARQIVQRRTLYARAVNNGELAIALSCLRDEAALLGLGRQRNEDGPQKADRIARLAQAIEGPRPGESPGGADPGAA